MSNPSDYSPESFLRALSKIDRSRSDGEKFRDFCEMAYCAIAKKTAPTEADADALEDRYMRVVGRYRDKDDVRKYPELLAMLMMGLQDCSTDYLGTVSSQLEILNPKQGQFFTPMSVSLAMATMLIGDLKPQIEESGYLSFYEGCCGAGAMVLAAAHVYQTQNVDHSLHMFAYAADISEMAYQMCFIQLSMAGIPAYVEHANSLSGEHFDGAWTVAAYRFRDYHGHTHFDRPRESQIIEIAKPKPQAEAAPVRLRQLSMFDT
jgi:hypothetical protein